MNKSFKTTLSGVLLAIGGAIPLITSCLGGDCDFGAMANQLVVILGALGLGYFARDNNVTSENAGAK